jgi:hypothetical protein
MGATNL